jgi:hypothetical protein
MRPLLRQAKHLVRSLICIPTRNRLSFTDLPRDIRDRIYRHVLHNGEWLASEDPNFPHVPEAQFGLLLPRGKSTRKLP